MVSTFPHLNGIVMEHAFNLLLTGYRLYIDSQMDAQPLEITQEKYMYCA